jgi:hypothetical protein
VKGQPSRRIAFHEAGHAVACLRYGIRFEVAALYGDNGEVISYPKGIDARDLAAIVFSGPVPRHATQEKIRTFSWVLLIRIFCWPR